MFKERRHVLVSKYNVSSDVMEHFMYSSSPNGYTYGVRQFKIMKMKG